MFLTVRDESPWPFCNLLAFFADAFRLLQIIALRVPLHQHRSRLRPMIYVKFRLLNVQLPGPDKWILHVSPRSCPPFFRLWGKWGRCGLVRLARGGGGREWSCASGGRPGAFWST